jgi:IPT/TIG domain-containing protein
MAINVQKVKAGDLITATYVNSIVDALNSLQEQIDAIDVSAPSTGSKPVITNVDPSPVPLASTMTIHGHNFAVPASLNTVTVDGTPLNDFPAGSNDQNLLVSVPGNLTPGTKSLVVQTTAGGASDPKSVTFIAADIEIAGQVLLTNTSGSLGEINVGDTVLFQFQLDGTAMNVPEQFSIVATYENVVGSSLTAWNSATSYIGTSGTDHQVTVSPLSPGNVGVQVHIPDATSADLIVQAVSVNNDPESSSVPQTIPIVIGEAPPAADPSIVIALGTNNRPSVHPNAAGDGLDIRFGASAIITIETDMVHAGDYLFEGAVQNPDTAIWEVLNLPQTIHFGDGQGQEVQFRLHLVPPMSEVSVNRSFTLTATRQNDDGIGQISNFLTFNIGGFLP